MTPTETLVAELETAERILHDKPCEVYGLKQTCAAARTTLTTQSALIETLTRERDGLQHILNNRELSLADARNAALEEAAVYFDGFAEKAALEARANYNPRVDDLDEPDDDTEQEWLEALDRKSIAEGHAKRIRALKSA